METNLLDKMLDQYLTGRIPVVITLQNKIRVTGRITAFDNYVLIMENHKQEILYRHAISCLSPLVHDEYKRQTASSQPTVVKTVRSTPVKNASHRPKPAQPQVIPSSATEGLNNSMKDGLLRWIQEQKAAK
jgi:RNA chaperone Hfq